MSVLVSVVIPCYNHGQYLPEAIASVEENTDRSRCEIIIVDDGSTDPQTSRVLDELGRRGYHTIRQPNQGLAAARNNGIAAAKGKYILPLDSDNRLHQNYLTTAVELLEADASLDVVYGNPQLFGDADALRPLGLKRLSAFDLGKMLNENYIDACALYRKSVWEKVGGYDGAMPAMGHEDWELWIHAYSLGCRFHHLDELCFYYRVLNTSMIVTDGARKHELNKKYIYKKHGEFLVPYLLNSHNQLRYVQNYLQCSKLKSIAKVVLSYKF